MVDDVSLVRIDEIDEARAGLAGILRRTPTERSSTFSKLCERPVLLKSEHLQRTGSFKIRGAYHLISHLDPSSRWWWPPRPATTPRGWRWPRRCSASAR